MTVTLEGSVPVAGARVVVADDDVLLREGIVSVLREAGYDVVGQADDAATLTQVLRSARPDLAVIDIRMPPTNTWEGIDAAIEIRREFPDIGILLLSAHVELDTAMELLEGGERIGYLLKSRVIHASHIVDALQRIASGGAVIDPALVQELVAERRRSDPLAELTARELEVLGLVAEGRSNSGIAQLLWISEGAVEKHVRSVLAKLQVPAGSEDNRRVLVVLAFLHSR